MPIRLPGLVLLLLLCGPGWGADWPQRQGNPQHTGYTYDSPQPPYKLAWKYYFPDDEEKVHPQVQPVIYRGGVFVGTKQGSVYCIDSTSGRLRWKRTAATGPILNTLACADGRVIVSSLDGHVRALDTQDGKLLWTMDGGIHGFNTAPCVAEGKVFIGGRAGVFYCLDQNTGKPLWQRDMGQYIYCSAAYHDGRVYFGTQDMIFHCLDAADGRSIWHSDRLYGISFKEFFPVISNGKVIIRTFSNVDAFPIPVERSYIEAATVKGQFARVPVEVSDSFLQHLRQSPQDQSFFVFDEKTGRVPFVVCHNRSGTNDGVPGMPAVDAQGNWYIALTARNPDKYWAGMIFASIDANTGRFRDFVWDSNVKQCNSDEQQNFSVGGDILFCSQQEEEEAGVWFAMNLKTHKRYAIPKTMPWLTGLNYNQQQAGGHGFAISGNRFYHIAYHCLSCWEGTEAPAAEGTQP